MSKVPRILLIDDEKDLLLLSERILVGLGYRVIAASCSLEALELFKDLPEQFDLIITDYRMPKMNGDQLSREILQINPLIPIIMCSGYTSDFGRADAAEIGIKWYVRKPLMKKDFVELVDKVLAEGSANC